MFRTSFLCVLPSPGLCNLRNLDLQNGTNKMSRKNSSILLIEKL